MPHGSTAGRTLDAECPTYVTEHDSPAGELLTDADLAVGACGCTATDHDRTPRTASRRGRPASGSPRTAAGRLFCRQRQGLVGGPFATYESNVDLGSSAETSPFRAAGSDGRSSLGYPGRAAGSRPCRRRELSLRPPARRGRTGEKASTSAWVPPRRSRSARRSIATAQRSVPAARGGSSMSGTTPS